MYGWIGRHRVNHVDYYTVELLRPADVKDETQVGEYSTLGIVAKGNGERDDGDMAGTILK